MLSKLMATGWLPCLVAERSRVMVDVPLCYPFLHLVDQDARLMFGYIIALITFPTRDEYSEKRDQNVCHTYRDTRHMPFSSNQLIGQQLTRIHRTTHRMPNI